MTPDEVGKHLRACLFETRQARKEIKRLADLQARWAERMTVLDNRISLIESLLLNDSELMAQLGENNE